MGRDSGLDDLGVDATDANGEPRIAGGQLGTRRGEGKSSLGTSEGRSFESLRSGDAPRAAGSTQAHPARGPVEARIERSIGRLYGWLEHNRLTRRPWAVIQTFSRAEGALLSGSMAYYTFLSLFPLLMLSGFVVGTISRFNVDARQALATGVERVIPVAEGVRIVDQLVHARFAFGVIGLVTLGYAGSGFIGALTACVNRMWEVPKGRNPVGQKLLNLGVVGLLGLVIMGSVGVTVWASDLAREALGGRAGDLLRVNEWVASPLSLFLVLLMLYRLLPARHLSWRSQMPGAAAAAVAIEVLKRAFAFWAQNSVGVDAVPRSVLSIVLLLVWLGFLAQAMLYGVAINVVFHRAPKNEHDSEPVGASPL
jgi:membrane protein